MKLKMFVLLFIILLITACSSEKNETSLEASMEPSMEPSVTEETPAPTATAPAEPVNLVIYSSANFNTTEEAYNDQFGSALKKKFPHYNFEYLRSNRDTGVTIENLVVSNTKFDLMYNNSGTFEDVLIKHDLGVDLTDLIDKHGIDLSIVEPSLIDATILNSGGELLGVPFTSNTDVLYYNKALFDRLGVDYPKDGMFWDEVIELSHSMTRVQDGVQYHGFVQNNSHTLSYNQLSIPFVDPESGNPTINHDPRWNLFYDTLFVQMFKDPIYRETTLHHINNFTKDQDTAMLYWVLNLLVNFQENIQDMDWDIVSAPTYREYPGIGMQSSGLMMGLTKYTENIDAAMQVLNYMVTEEFQIGISKQGRKPSVVNEKTIAAFGENLPFGEKNYEAVFYNTPAAVVRNPEFNPRGPYSGIIPKLMQGTEDMNTAFRTAEEELQLLIKQHNESQSN